MKRNCAYIDGSFNPKYDIYGAGIVLFDQSGLKYVLYASGNNPELVRLRNVAGEILASKKAIELAHDLYMGSLKIYHDYKGVANWVTGEWCCNNWATQEYRNFVREKMDEYDMNITFEHVKGHSGVLEHEEADRLAKYGCRILNALKGINAKVLQYDESVF